MRSLAFSGKRPACDNLSLRIFQVQDHDERSHFLIVSRQSRDQCGTRNWEYRLLTQFERNNFFLHFLTF